MKKTLIIQILIALIILSGVGYLGYMQYGQNSFNQKIENDLNTASSTLAQKISDIETILLAAQADNTTMAEALAAAKEKADSLDSQFKKVNSNVATLEKITKTDPELLQKYSKIFFLNDNYVPADLSTIPSKYTFLKTKTYKLQDQVLSHLEDLMDDAEDDEMSLQIISAFRSFGEQAQLKGAYTVNYGAGTANSFSADQGYSEHQLGTTVDFTNPTVADTFSGFSKSEEYTWLQDNAYKYGFVISYPEDNTYYQFEPWHWRFVGLKLAKYLHTKDKYFYDLTQREIDAYIANFFD
jgi:LAS superfamily LD-carboxypeptidase LdcB